MYDVRPKVRRRRPTYVRTIYDGRRRTLRPTYERTYQHTYDDVRTYDGHTYVRKYVDVRHCRTTYDGYDDGLRTSTMYVRTNVRKTYIRKYDDVRTYEDDVVRTTTYVRSTSVLQRTTDDVRTSSYIRTSYVPMNVRMTTTYNIR